MFKDSFKYYKSKNPAPKLDEVLDIHNEAENLIKNQQLQALPIRHLSGRWGLKPSSQWEVYIVADCPGLIYIKNPFVAHGQRYWSMRCLKDYSKKENRRNIDQFNIVPDHKEWWDIAQSDKDVMRKLRWATLGYHHNWDTKVYTEENKGIFPNDLSILTKKIAEVLGYFNFNSEAAIVNYYHMDSTLSGHIDHSEQNLEAPLFSFSFGQTAIFLLGGKTIDEKPVALLLKSGDVIVMSKESRLAYHGVPKILESKEKPWNVTENIDELETDLEGCGIFTDEDQWKPFDEYLESSRININNLTAAPKLAVAMTSYILPAVVLSFFSVCYLTYIVASAVSLNTYWTRDVLSISGLTLIYFLLNWSFYVILCVPPMEPPAKYRLCPTEIEEYKYLPTPEGRQLYLYQMTFEKNLDVITRKSTGLIRYCRYCKLIKPDRAHHCSVCGKCILKMDHHCPWLNNCIGFNNYKVFLLSSIYSLIFFCYFSFTLAPVFLDLWDNGDPYYFSIIILVLFAAQLFLGAVITIFLVYHIHFLLRNETYIEHLFPVHFISKRMTFNIQPFDNFKEVFGDKWQYWLIPTVSCIGDGCTFPYRLIRSDGRTISLTTIKSTPSAMSTN